ncbi:5'-methylthioadenosine/S-adenosylhomocysteine nucleosidase [Alishewanella sp. 16-MA]|uniref:5'-methylthioadenosine/S-adenosylhomocysteine nucleosidase n=1 Tax=Alishewanella maricola TaxID=2795740 RepID=A0ABS8C4F9_9ALTE|nr:MULTISPECIES: 5'-methylthioadenosine/S-adenosylhomocysteine nucleosidase [Alishewanella]MDP4944485.1 5'-methylthioadenosine/S-adenosylhomocysteine nucleosidase [Alishewanella sp.]MCB5227202.1 5'-methylthioadenosine/S-adenosylhomocysteine nucleosidase [Alishewanella maricola]MDP5037222.1 5'-methylthioadenosine/S-adenosylhomocysteine nucleosidase [Alishewanella sp.]MDP5187876.1 5'-methylthioadenosine/S-adenosylhomocysteine nucleosidase [Alishewanella sp.]MDP5459314.1 5'-methylthioadenosine/S-
MQLIGIIGAMEPEIALLQQQIELNRTEKLGGYTFYIGTLAGKNVVLVQSGIGKVAAAVATTLMICQFKPDCIINTGSAGGFDPELSVGDVVISTEVRHHDVDVTAFGYEMGQVPQMPAAYKAHPALMAAAEQSIAALGFCKTKKGLIATGDSFMCDPERIAQTRQHFPSMLAVEMEGAAIAQSCHMLNTPFVVIRSLSDIAGKESPDSFEAYLEVAAKNSSAMVMEMLGAIADLNL